MLHSGPQFVAEAAWVEGGEGGREGGGEWRRRGAGTGLLDAEGLLV
jgi:hypothetical protein